MASTLRLPAELDDRLAEHCRQVGATKNRVCCLALRAYLDDDNLPPRVVLTPREPDDSAFPDQPVGAARLVRSLADLGLDTDEIADATGLDPARVSAALQPDAEKP